MSIPVRFRASLWGILFMMLATSSTGEETPALRVMSFNLRYGLADDGDDSWPHRRDLVVETVRRFDPDLLGTQETVGFQGAYLQERLDGYVRVGWSRQPDSPDGEQCAILYRISRFDRQDAGQFWLSETPEEPGSRSWDSAFPRVVTWVRLRDREHGGAELVLFDTHFDNLGREARRQSAHLLRDRLGAVEPPVAWVVTGDFNAAEDSPPHAILVGSAPRGRRVIDSYRAAHPRRAEGDGTFHGFSGDRSGGRIDWILHSSLLETVSADIDHTEREGRFPSDHFPVTAVLRWRTP